MTCTKDNSEGKVQKTPRMKEQTESEVRAMRDRVYGGTIGDAAWAVCRAGWMDPKEVEWLKEQNENNPPK